MLASLYNYWWTKGICDSILHILFVLSQVLYIPLKGSLKKTQLALQLLHLSEFGEKMNGFNKPVTQGYATGRWDKSNLCVSMSFQGHVENMHVQTGFTTLWHMAL